MNNVCHVLIVILLAGEVFAFAFITKDVIRKMSKINNETESRAVRIEKILKQQCGSYKQKD